MSGESLITEEGQINWAHSAYFVNVPEQIVEFTFTWRKDNHIISGFRSRQAMIYKREFELLLKLAGFRNWQVYGGFEYQPLESYKQMMVWIVEK